eukprot:4942916-Alexandrium_andersonii.AAC.1
MLPSPWAATPSTPTGAELALPSTGRRRTSWARSPACPRCRRSASSAWRTPLRTPRRRSLRAPCRNPSPPSSRAARLRAARRRRQL